MDQNAVNVSGWKGSQHPLWSRVLRAFPHVEKLEIWTTANTDKGHTHLPKTNVTDPALIWANADAVPSRLHTLRLRGNDDPSACISRHLFDLFRYSGATFSTCIRWRSPRSATSPPGGSARSSKRCGS